MQKNKKVQYLIKKIVDNKIKPNSIAMNLNLLLPEMNKDSYQDSEYYYEFNQLILLN